MRASGVSYAVQRVTQFHTLIDTLFSAQLHLSVALTPEGRFQGIAVGQIYSQFRAARAVRCPSLQNRIRRRPGDVRTVSTVGTWVRVLSRVAKTVPLPIT